MAAIDLTDAVVVGADLRESALRRSNLRHTNLRHTNLTDAT